MTAATAFLAVLLGFGAVPSYAALDRGCAASRDYTVQALEKVSASSPSPQIERADALLQRAEQMCASNADARYYRSIMERKLGHNEAADFLLQRARLIRRGTVDEVLTEALDEGRNPFELATHPEPAASDPTPVPTKKGSSWALIVGIGQFQDKNLDPLKYTASDANLFATVLRDPARGAFAEDHIHTLLDGQATTKAIKASLNWIARQAQPEDTVVVYVATHGSARDVDEVGGVNYLITADTEVGPEQSQDLLFGSALPMIDLIDTVATRIRALRTAIFIDTCYSGSVQAGDRKQRANSLDAHMLEQMGQGAGRIIMAASKDDQESQQSDTLQHGYFTYYLVQALQNNPGMPLAELFPVIQQEVSASVAVDKKKFHVTQTPVLTRSSTSTDFALIQQPARSAPGGL